MIARQSLIWFTIALLPLSVEVVAQVEPIVPQAIPVETLPELEAAVPRAVPVEAAPEAILPERGFDGEALNPDLPVGLSIISPGAREVVSGNTLDLFLSLQNYALGDPERGGNRIHVILDNQPPRIVYDVARPVTFTNLATGGHTVRVFACRPDGTAIRDSSAYAMIHFFIGQKDFQNYVDPRTPYITVNLPGEGSVDSTAEGMVVFDYIVHLPDAMDGFRVRYDLSGGYTGELTQQGPVYWNNFSPGKHRLFVEFLDKNGRLVPGPFNQIEREFVVPKVIRARPATEEDLQEESGEELPVPQALPVE
jgi:hypothetical protein